jgi:hypothetical protein
MTDVRERHHESPERPFRTVLLRMLNDLRRKLPSLLGAAGRPTAGRHPQSDPARAYSPAPIPSMPLMPLPPSITLSVVLV